MGAVTVGVRVNGQLMAEQTSTSAHHAEIRAAAKTIGSAAFQQLYQQHLQRQAEAESAWAEQAQTARREAGREKRHRLHDLQQQRMRMYAGLPQPPRAEDHSEDEADDDLGELRPFCA